MPPQLPTRKLGKYGPQVPALGFGVMGLSAFYGKADPDEVRFPVLDRAYELGETFWDSADVYGDSEDLLGEWFKRTGKRDEIFLATKVWMTFIGCLFVGKGGILDIFMERELIGWLFVCLVCECGESGWVEED
jgi:hypothetical protein